MSAVRPRSDRDSRTRQGRLLPDLRPLLLRRRGRSGPALELSHHRRDPIVQLTEQRDEAGGVALGAARDLLGCVADWSPAGLVASELYDHYGDDGVGAAAYDDFENVNLAHEPARRAQVQALAARLRAQFERAPGC